ncbi:MAG: PaaI family thioesterase [Planctomycetes bacterium]|nr:PaaI family thioesterase [Planctomycetota bacterium]
MATPFDEVPVHRWLGCVLRERSPQRAVVEMPVRAEMLQGTGVVQGGLLTALADTTAVQLLWPDLAAPRTMIGIDCQMQFLAPGHAEQAPLVATATPLRVGATIAVAEAVVTQGARLLAKGTFTFLLRAQRGAAN